MTAVLDLLSAYGRDAAIAASVVLAIGAFAALLCRAPAHRQRVSELAVVVALATGALAFVPLRMRGAEPRPAEVSTSPAWTVVEPAGALAPEVASSAPLAPPVVPNRPPVSAELLIGLLVAGAACVASYGILGWFLLARTVRRTRAATGRVSALAGSLHGAPVRVRVCDRTSRPYCCGVLRPMVLVPASLIGREVALRAVLLHELVHLRRRDPLGRLLMTAAAPLLFWQPLFWWLSRDARRSAELVADDVAAHGMGKRRYALELLRLAERTHHLPALGSPAVPVLRDPEDLFRRMEMLIHRTTPLAAESTPFHRALSIVGATALLAGVTLAWGRPQDIQPPRESVPAFDGDSSVYPAVLAGSWARTPKESTVLQTVVVFRDSADVGHFTLALLRRGVDVQGIRLEPGSNRQLRLQLSGDGVFDEFVAADAETDGIKIVSVMVWNPKLGGDANARSVDGKVVNVNTTDDRTLVAINLGRVDGVEPGSRFSINDGSTYKGSLRVESVSDRTSTGWLTIAPDGSRVYPGDSVATDPGSGSDDGHDGGTDSPPVLVITGSVLRTQDSLYTTIVEINRGTNDGVSEGSTFEVYRGATYKGRVEVVDVQPESCAGVVRKLLEGATIGPGDAAATRLTGEDPGSGGSIRVLE